MIWNGFFQMEVKVYKQKVKHLLYEQENHLAELKAENMVSRKSLDSVIVLKNKWLDSEVHDAS